MNLLRWWIRAAVPAAVIAAAMPAWSQGTPDAAYTKLYGGVYSSDCGNTDEPRLRIVGDSLIVEQGTRRMVGRTVRPNRTFFGQLAPPEFQVALLSTARNGFGLYFVVYRGASGVYITLGGSPEIEAELGESLLGRKYRRCDPVSEEITSAPPSPVAATHADDIDWKTGKLASLASTIGTYQYDKVLGDARVRRAIEALVPAAERASLKTNLSVCGPIDFIDGFLVLFGNAPHHGGEENAAVWIRIYDGTVYVALLRHGMWTLYANESLYRYLPLQLRMTVADRSMGGPHEPPDDVRWIHTP